MKNKKNFLVIGNTIKHSLSPLLHNYWFHKNKINCEYKKLKTTKAEIKNSLLAEKFSSFDISRVLAETKAKK